MYGDDPNSFFEIQGDLEDAWAVAHVPPRYRAAMVRFLVWLSQMEKGLAWSEAAELVHYVVSVVNFPELDMPYTVDEASNLMDIASEFDIVSLVRDPKTHSVISIAAEPNSVVYLVAEAQEHDAALNMVQQIDYREPGVFGDAAQTACFALSGHWKEIALAVVTGILDGGTVALEGGTRAGTSLGLYEWCIGNSQHRFGGDEEFFIALSTLEKLGLIFWIDCAMVLDQEVAAVFLTATNERHLLEILVANSEGTR